MTYRFASKDVVHGQIEIEAESGFEAERLFHEMSLEQRLAASNVGVDKNRLDIKFAAAAKSCAWHKYHLLLFYGACLGKEIDECVGSRPFRWCGRPW